MRHAAQRIRAHVDVLPFRLSAAEISPADHHGIANRPASHGDVRLVQRAEHVPKVRDLSQGEHPGILGSLHSRARVLPVLLQVLRRAVLSLWLEIRTIAVEERPVNSQMPMHRSPFIPIASFQ